jgi:hypothetical protein
LFALLGIQFWPLATVVSQSMRVAGFPLTPHDTFQPTQAHAKNLS